MPIHKSKDISGNYFQWGQHGHKYYFNPMNASSIYYAHQKALKQAQAIYSNGYMEKKKYK